MLSTNDFMLNALLSKTMIDIGVFYVNTILFNLRNELLLSQIHCAKIMIVKYLSIDISRKSRKIITLSLF